MSLQTKGVSIQHPLHAPHAHTSNRFPDIKMYENVSATSGICAGNDDACSRTRAIHNNMTLRCVLFRSNHLRSVAQNLQ